MTKIRPVVVCQTTVAGGAERYLTTLYREFHKRGHEPRLLGNVPGWTEAGLPATAVALGPKWDGRRTLKLLPRLPAERRAVVADRGPGCTGFHVQFKREQIGLTGPLSAYAPVLWTEHGRFKGGAEGKLLGAAYRRAARRAAAIICVSEVVADDVRHIVGRTPRVFVVPNAIDTTAVRPATTEQRAEARRSLGLPADEPVLAWVGQLHAGKLPLLAAKVGRQFPGVTVIAGKGALSGEVQAAVDGNRVRFLGFQADPSPIYRAADVFLFTSRGVNEGFPTNSMLEAAAHGLPMVTNSGSGFAGDIGKLGGIVAGDNPAELSAGASLAVAEGESRSQLARVWAEQHDLAPWVASHEEIHRSFSGQ